MSRVFTKPTLGITHRADFRSSIIVVVDDKERGVNEMIRFRKALDKRFQRRFRRRRWY